MSIENKDHWENIDDAINEEERRMVEERKHKEEVEGVDFVSNTPLSKYFESIREEVVGKRRNELKEKESLPEEAKDLVSLRWKNLYNSLKENKKTEDEAFMDETLLRWIEEDIKRKDVRNISTRTELTDSIKERIRFKKEKQEEIKQSSPEAYIGINLQEFRQQIERVRKGFLAETDYVKKMKEWGLKTMNSGEHLFLHGHLGGGKTDFAIDTAIERMINLNINREIDQWAKDNPNTDEKELLKKQREVREKYEKGFEQNDPEIMEKVRPFLIAGSKDFDLQDLYIEKSLKVTKFNGQTVSEHSKAVEEEIDKWKEENKERLLQLSEEERVGEEINEREKVLELYKMKHTGFGTEVEKIKKELYRAVLEGKPIIIDEANAIPPTLLISMNDILTSKPGEMAFIPGEDPVEVKEGFSIIMTGNLEASSMAEYFGTQEMNPAFLSRLNVREYDYLPQNKYGNVFEQEKPEENELFQVTMAFLANKDGSLSLPKGSMDKVFKLCQLAKVTQEVFAGKWKESEMRAEASGDEAIEPRLEKSVLSVRGIVKVLREWNKGQDVDLDKALWESFISSATMPADQNFILNEAKKYGFFLESNGWKVDSASGNISSFSEKDIRTKDYNYIRPEDYHYSKRDLIEIMHGKAPERVEFPEVSPEVFSGEGEVDLEKINEWQELEEEISKYERAFAAVIEKECPLDEE